MEELKTAMADMTLEQLNVVKALLDAIHAILLATPALTPEDSAAIADAVEEWLGGDA